ELHRPTKLRPKYFFLLAQKNGRYDKNILPSEITMQSLVRRLSEKYEVGIHPSWQSGEDDAVLKQEIATLESISKLNITASRQHYIRFSLPETYRKLIAAGIQKEYSMG